jgi:hypothetical protein
MVRRSFRTWLALLIVSTSSHGADVVKPYPRQHYLGERRAAWEFDRGAEGWHAANDCSVIARTGTIRVLATGADPFLESRAIRARETGPALARLRMKCRGQGPGEIYWTTNEAPTWSPERRAKIALVHDDNWRIYDVHLEVAGALERIRLDPGDGPGEVDIDFVLIFAHPLHPLEIERLTTTKTAIDLVIRNHDRLAHEVTVRNFKGYLGAASSRSIALEALSGPAYEYRRLVVATPTLPPLERLAFIHRPTASTGSIARQSGRLQFLFERDGSGFRVASDGIPIAIVAPLVHFDGTMPRLRLAGETSERITFVGEGVNVVAQSRGDELGFEITSEKPCEGPVVRPLGALEQGLFAGLEYLGKGESSSSTRDIETADHLRFEPAPRKVTLPLMACRTIHATVALTWSDMSLQPVFATPNFLDGAPGHRMALRGSRIRAQVLVRATSLESAIEWAVRRQGLPPIPRPARSADEQRKLCLAAFDGPLKGTGGWGHCAEPNWDRHPFADCSSTVFRLTGSAPRLARITAGGGHIANDTIYFVTGRAGEWLAHRRSAISAILAEQKPDGSFRYQGRYQRGHFEDTSSGYCAVRAADLLEFAAQTGDEAALNAGLKTLEYMKRFRTPRGAQTWELSLHTPDILAAAHLVRGYVRGYELTSRREWLDLAKKWAWTGVPFVYLWADRPIMAYATVPVYGATNWQAPNWIGRPVQWCGLVYAHALVDLARHDPSFDWLHLARGILAAGEQMQHPGGRLVGCLPDAFDLERQERIGPSINPSALVSLRMAVEGQAAGLTWAQDGKARILAPFGVILRDGLAEIAAPPTTEYQVLINGAEVVSIKSTGRDLFRVSEVKAN